MARSAGRSRRRLPAMDSTRATMQRSDGSSPSVLITGDPQALGAVIQSRLRNLYPVNRRLQNVNECRSCGVCHFAPALACAASGEVLCSHFLLSSPFPFHVVLTTESQLNNATLFSHQQSHHQSVAIALL